MIRYWIKILSSKDNFIPKKIYMLIKLDADNNITYNGLNWAYQVKGILDSLGLSHIWIHQFEMDVPFSLINQRIFDMYKQSWYATINNSNRLLLYARFKHDFNFEKIFKFYL